MKKSHYEVGFVSGKLEYVYAWNDDEARILAQAEQIKKGNDYEILYIKNL